WYNVLYLILRRPRSPTLFPYTTLFRSGEMNRIDVDFCIPHILSCQQHAKLISDMCEVVGMLQPLNGSSDDFVQARVIRIIQQSDPLVKVFESICNFILLGDNQKPLFLHRAFKMHMQFDLGHSLDEAFEGHTTYPWLCERSSACFGVTSWRL